MRAHRGPLLSAVGLAAALLFALTGWILVSDEPGLRTEFFLLDVEWQGGPLFTNVQMPKVDEQADLEGVISPSIYSVRWHGKMFVERSGQHRFSLWADDGAYLELDGARVVETARSRGGSRGESSVNLTEGFHTIEIGLQQKVAEVGLGVEWTPPGGEPAVLPEEVLYARRPAWLYRALRQATAPLSALGARLAGAVLMLLSYLSLVALLAARPELFAAWRRSVGDLLSRLPPQLGRLLESRRFLHTAFFVALFVVTFLAAMPWTVTTLASDDANYVMISQFGADRAGSFNRMAHIYLLQLFIALFGGGDAFFGSRVYGAFVFAATVTALAVAVRALGPRLQLRTLAVTLILLFSQTAVTRPLGAAYTDNTVMMIVTVAVAVFLLGRSAESSRPNHEWYAFALGVLTLVAGKSKVTGVIILVLPALLLWTEGRIDWRRFARRMAYWSAGFAAAFVVLLVADALRTGDLLWALRPENFKGGVGAFLKAGEGSALRPDLGWISVLWPAGATPADLGLRNLWLLALVAPLVAAVKGVPLERRLLYLLPTVYLLMMIVMYIRLWAPLFGNRMLLPVIPVTCLVGGSLFLHLGLERPTARELLSPRVFVPLYLAAAVICLIVTPYLAGEIQADALVPSDFTARFGWQPEHFMNAVQLPTVVLTALALASLCFASRRGRLALALLVVLALQGAAFHQSTSELEYRYNAQRTERILYPWRVFEEEIEAVRPELVHISADVVWRLKMISGHPNALAMIFFDRPKGFVVVDDAVPRDAELAITSRDRFRKWSREAPALAETATLDPSGELVLLRIPGKR